MKLQLLGTAAFEGIPSLFCTCDLCKKAIQLGGKNIRSRTSAMIDNELKIDFPPDSLHHMHRFGLNYEQVKDILFTHSHSDHLYAEDLAARLPGYGKSLDHTLQLYGNDLVLSKCMHILAVNGGLQQKFQLNRLQPFVRTMLQTASIVPLPASHDPLETCFIFYIEKEGKAILYGHDSGDFPSDVWEWLEQEALPLDLVVLECTMGYNHYRLTHMNVDAVLETVAKLRLEQLLKQNAPVIVTHFSHNAQLLHEDLEAIFERHGITTAYDGLIVEI
ncbi:MBL fold metallo-hydrolase [Paenibacillus sp. GXUN7292]|uniref:MBL fold metallo-hydrolase n=1 Tax=Paenibacillus sp. GXUN7292 TaxID=3422499 RepID=UPI003D7C4881